MQPERTGLAWNRTLVVLAVAFGVLGVHAYRDGIEIAFLAICALITAAILLVSWSFARFRSHRAIELIDGTIRQMSPVPLWALSGVSCALAAASGALIIFRG